MKIQLKRSNVLEDSAAKAPTSAQMAYGELAVNYNVSDPAIFLKASDDSIIKIAGADSAGSGASTLQEVLTNGNTANKSIELDDASFKTS